MTAFLFQPILSTEILPGGAAGGGAGSPPSAVTTP